MSDWDSGLVSKSNDQGQKILIRTDPVKAAQQTHFWISSSDCWGRPTLLHGAAPPPLCLAFLAFHSPKFPVIPPEETCKIKTRTHEKVKRANLQPSTFIFTLWNTEVEKYSKAIWKNTTKRKGNMWAVTEKVILFCFLGSRDVLLKARNVGKEVSYWGKYGSVADVCLTNLTVYPANPYMFYGNKSEIPTCFIVISLK